ncbi:MAG TPA: HAMP domain-containing sensor histidine kinase, partial [Gemmatimonadales bacterium]|nr:HAMP domain-containing sensor histidine kinase [Gemmatimonadales bacterium]
LALGTSDSFTTGGATYTIAGGTALDSVRLAGLSRAPGIEVLIILPGESLPGGADSLGAVPLRYVDLAGAGPAAEPARLAIVARSSPLAELPRRIDRWFLGAIVVTLLLALGLALWLATRVSRPIRELSARTAALDLDRLDQDFASDRRDELGDLSNLLDAMTRRLRAGAVRLREAERRAAFGDLARQVNHDIRNGLAPMRHVVRHLGEVASEHPAELPAVFAERRATLESSIQYLEELARNYARLGPVPAPGATDLNVVVREVARALAGDGARIDTQLADGIQPARADAVTLRRIVENLAVNAVESLPGGRGTVTLATRPGADPQHVRLMVSDTGSGMTRAELERAFDDFHTTKPTGTGLGLSVVRRLVADLGGSLQVSTEPGAGTRFTIDLPCTDAGPALPGVG